MFLKEKARGIGKVLGGLETESVALLVWVVLTQLRETNKTVWRAKKKMERK